MKVLVTAFKPFNQNTNNYSKEVLNYINNVDKQVIDVIYDLCYQELTTKLDLNQYDLIIAMGEARKRSELTLEISAKNIASCSLPDNNNEIKKDQLIDLNGDFELKTKVDVDKIKDLIIFSYDAGKFVCNNLYYHLLANYPHKSLFIHIPECFNDELHYLKHAKTIELLIQKLGEK